MPAARAARPAAGTRGTARRAARRATGTKTNTRMGTTAVPAVPELAVAPIVVILKVADRRATASQSGRATAVGGPSRAVKMRRATARTRAPARTRAVVTGTRESVIRGSGPRGTNGSATVTASPTAKGAQVRIRVSIRLATTGMSAATAGTRPRPAVAKMVPPRRAKQRTGAVTLGAAIRPVVDKPVAIKQVMARETVKVGASMERTAAASPTAKAIPVATRAP